MPLSEPPSQLYAAARVLLLLFFPALLFFLAGPIRYQTGLGLTASYLVAVAPFALLAFALYRRRAAFRPGIAGALVAFGSFALVAGYAWRLLFNPYFSGMMNCHGVDAGFHLVLHNHFRTISSLYGGAVGLLALTNALTRLGVPNSFFAFRLVFYGAVFAVVASMIAAALLVNASARPMGRRGRVAALFFGLVVALPLTRFAILPILHQIQADGFFPEVFAMAPLMLGYVAYAVAERPWLRVALLVATCVATRYSYGLNFADLAWTAAALALVEWRDVGSSSARAVLVVLALVLVAGGVAVLKILYPVMSHYGYLLPFRYWMVAPTELALLGFVAASPLLLRQLGVTLEGAGTRVVRFAVLFATFNLALEIVYQLAGETPNYYFYKHVFACTIVLVAATTAVTATLLGACIDRLAAAGWAVLPPALAALISVGALPFGLYYGFDEYEAALTERAYGKPPFERLEALYDPSAQQFIDETVRASGKPFAAYITDKFVLTTFMSYLNGAEQGVNVAEYMGEPMIFRDDPGFCYFWTDPPPNQPFRRQIDKFRAHGPRCIEHRLPWDPGKQQQLCGVCF